LRKLASALLALAVAALPRALAAGGSGEKDVTPLGVAPGVPAPGEPAALTESDVVRMLAAGQPEEAILRVIHDRPVSFDLSEEMLAELRQAGVSERVLAAMSARQIGMQPKRPAGAEEAEGEPVPGHALVRIVFRPEAGQGDAALYLPVIAGKDLAERLQLQALPEDRQVSDIALFVACRTKAHVPGLWRSSSPLGRDFVTMPPHEILAFESGARRVPRSEVPESARAAHEAEASTEWLRLDVPAELTAQVETGTAHDLIVGVAALLGDHYLALTLAKANDVSANAELRIPAVIRGGGGHGPPFEVRLEPPPEAEAPKPPKPKAEHPVKNR